MSVTRFAVIWGVLLAFALPAVEAHATPWVVSGAVVRGDFDNDGNLETVASSPQSEGTRGVVHVVDGAAGTATRWTRATSGLAGGGAAVGDYFGAALAVGDFDGDGFDDLLVSAPGADDAGPSDSGVLHVIYGSSGGLTTVGDQVFHQNTTGIGGVAEANDQLGDVLTVGDFNCDTYDDVVIGVPMESISSHAAAGAVHVLYGSSAGVTAVDDLYYQSLGGVNGLAEAGDHFGGGLATGNFNGDSDSGNACDDLAIGVPDEAIGAIASAGYVYTLLGGTSGLSTTGDIAFHQNVSGVSDVSESGDRFGLRMFTGDEDGDGYDDLAVVSPGDSCISGHGEAHHVFLGTSSGLTVTGNHIQCASYRCMIDEDTNVYACHSYSPPVYASDSADTIAMFVGNDVVYAGGGDDTIKGDFGDDVLFGSAGADTFDGGPGLDIQIGGDGDDVFIVDDDCEVVAGEVIDGGPGSNELRSHRSRAELVAMGMALSSVSVVTIPEVGGDCIPYPYEEGPFTQARVRLSWDDLDNNDSIYTTTSSTIALTLTNISDDDIHVDLRFTLLVQGHKAELSASGINVDANDSTAYVLDMEDFIPGGYEPEKIDPDLFDLPTSAILSTRAEIIVGSTHVGNAFARKLYGHLENAGGTMKVYRAGAYHATYDSGDLVGLRANRVTYSGPGTVIGRIEATVEAPP